MGKIKQKLHFVPLSFLFYSCRYISMIGIRSCTFSWNLMSFIQYWTDVVVFYTATLNGMADRTITMGSAGKTFSVTGWKIGWAIGPAHLISAMHLFHHLAVRGTPSVLQVNHWCDTIYANFTEITRNDWVYHMMELLNSDKIMNYPFNHTMISIYLQTLEEIERVLEIWKV